MTLEKYRKFAYESAQWLADRQNLDGSIDPAEDGLIDVFYKIPTALALNGSDVRSAPVFKKGSCGHTFSA